MKFRIREGYYIRRFLFTHSQPAFAKLYGRHTPALFRVAMQLTAGDRSIAEAIVIKTWTRAIEGVSSVSSIAQFGTRLTSLLVTCSREYYHTHQQYMLMHDPLCERIIARIKGPDSKSAEMNSELALELLPVGYRHVFVLHDINGYGHKAIGSLLKMSESASQRQLFKTRKTLRYLTGGSGEIKTFRSAYDHIDLPKELEWKVTGQLSAAGLIIPTPKKLLLREYSNAGFLFMRLIKINLFGNEHFSGYRQVGAER